VFGAAINDTPCTILHLYARKVPFTLYDTPCTILHLYARKVPFTLRYRLTPYRTVLFQKLKSSQVVKNWPAFYGAQTFIIVFTRAHHLSISRTRSIHSMPSHPNRCRFILKLYCHIRLGLREKLVTNKFQYFPLLKYGKLCFHLARKNTGLQFLNLVTNCVT
jgi:hypothetical protein